MLPVWLASVLLLLRKRGEGEGIVVMSDSKGTAEGFSAKVKRVRGKGG